MTADLGCVYYRRVHSKSIHEQARPAHLACAWACRSRLPGLMCDRRAAPVTGWPLWDDRYTVAISVTVVS